MPISLTYPGVYIEELPGPPATITPAPTSIAAFIGYTHPYKTQSFWEAVQIFSFQDYQRQFGGLYANAWIDSNVAYGVQQFFLNGGSEAYVVGIQSSSPVFTSWQPPALPPPLVSPATVPALGTPPKGGPSGTLTTSAAGATPATGITFWGLELVDPSHTITVTVTNITSSSPSASASSSSPLDLADYTFTYGSVVETFRRVSLNQTTSPGVPNPNFIETRINGTSQLVWVSPSAGSYAVFPAGFTPPAQGVSIQNATPPTTGAFSASDFTNSMNGPFVEDGSLDKVSIFNLMVIPGVTDASVLAQAVAFCERKRAFLIVDAPANCSGDGMAPPQPLPLAPAPPAIAPIIQSGIIPVSINAALYFPYLTSIDSLTGNPMRMPPSSTVAGIFAATDASRGVWKAPAGLGTVLTNVTGVVPEGILTDNREGVLNPLGVNCLRNLPGIGTVVYGARTTTTQNPALQQWRYVPVRRMALFIEQTLYASLGWAVFEPNDTPLWSAITLSVNAFMVTLFNQGAFQGSTPSSAFQVTCDSTTTTQTDINNGIVNVLVAFAPLKPAEFVVIQIQQLAGQAQS